MKDLDDKINKDLKAIYSAGNIDKETVWNNINEKIREKKIRLSFLKYASIIIFISSIIFFIFQENDKTPDYVSLKNESILNNAWFKLNNDDKIDLNDLIMKKLAIENYNVTDSVLYILPFREEMKCNDEVHSIYIPRGAEYKLILSDGTIVWINSDTEIRFPHQFTTNERKIYIVGEAFIEVVKDIERPFIVETPKSISTVLGTSFNIRSYTDEKCDITLESGSLLVAHVDTPEDNFILTPGQNARIDTIVEIQKDINPNEFFTWRHNEFLFVNKPLHAIIRDLERWYDFYTLYENELIENYMFTAWFKRDEAIDEVLKKLEQTQKIIFEMNNDTVIVKDYK